MADEDRSGTAPDASDVVLACENCKKSPPEVTLKRCAKCQITEYCSRDCQKANWKTHKKICGKPGQQPTPEASSSSSPFVHSTSREHLSPPKGLDSPIDKPFTRLDNGTWLHDRSEKDVYRLLIDAYRLRIEDEYKFAGDADVDSIYGGASSNVPGFKRFLAKAERRGGVLPAWWNLAKKAECIAFGRSGDNDWTRLDAAIEKGDVIEHYGDPRFPMQLRMFAEGFVGRGPWGGPDGSHMRGLMVAMENGGQGLGLAPGNVASVMTYDNSAIFGARR